MNEIITRDEAIDKKTQTAYTLNVGITWLDGRAIFNHSSKWSKCIFGICHLSAGVYAITPVDYDNPRMITSINASLVEDYCEKAYSCLNFTCRLNRFSKPVFLSEFSDIGEESLGLPPNIGEEPLWFSTGEWAGFWQKFIIYGEGGTIKFNESRTDIGD